jgi:elongation factor Ts
VKKLRDATGAGMMDAKRALTENDGDFAAASKWLREKGLGKAAERADRENAQGAVEVFRDGSVAAIVQLKCETDFVAASDAFKGLAQEIADTVAAQGEAAADAFKDRVDDLKITLKENIERGELVRVEAAADDVLDSYLHVQGGRGVNGVLVVLAGGTQELAHDIAVHIGFAKPEYLTRDEVPADVIAHERTTLEAITRNEGKPEQAIPKIVDGRINGFYKEKVLLEQPYAKDEKQTITQVLGSAKIVRFAQVLIG